MAIREAYSRANGKVGRYAGARIVCKKRFQNGISDAMFSQNNINLVNSLIDFFKALAEGFHLLSQARELGAVHHVVQPSELVGVEESRAGER
jgi:hypothetical protein